MNADAMLADALPAAPRAVALPPPIIVLGARPTATALIGAMIGCNPAAFALPQLNLFASNTVQGIAGAVFDPSQTQMHGLLRAVAYLYGSEQTIISIAMAQRWILRRLSWPTGEVFDELRRSVAPRRLVDKSPIYSQEPACLERICKTAPDAYYVHVIEHPLADAVVGGRRRASAAISPAGQTHWLGVQRVISAALNDVMPQRRTLLRMENLLADPRAELANLCVALDLPNDAEAIEEMLHPERSPFAGLGPVGANLGDDLVFLRDPHFPPKHAADAAPRAGGRRMLADVAQFAAQYGYD